MILLNININPMVIVRYSDLFWREKSNFKPWSNHILFQSSLQFGRRQDYFNHNSCIVLRVSPDE